MALCWVSRSIRYDYFLLGQLNMQAKEASTSPLSLAWLLSELYRAPSSPSCRPQPSPSTSLCNQPSRSWLLWPPVKADRHSEFPDFWLRRTDSARCCRWLLRWWQDSPISLFCVRSRWMLWRSGKGRVCDDWTCENASWKLNWLGLETRDGKKSYDSPPHSKQMQALNKKFGKIHGVSSLLNMVTLLATIYYGVVIGKQLSWFSWEVYIVTEEHSLTTC